LLSLRTEVHPAERAVGHLSLSVWTLWGVQEVPVVATRLASGEANGQGNEGALLAVVHRPAIPSLLAVVQLAGREAVGRARVRLTRIQPE